MYKACFYIAMSTSIVDKSNIYKLSLRTHITGVYYSTQSHILEQTEDKERESGEGGGEGEGGRVGRRHLRTIHLGTVHNRVHQRL